MTITSEFHYLSFLHCPCYEFRTDYGCYSVTFSIVTVCNHTVTIENAHCPYFFSALPASPSPSLFRAQQSPKLTMQNRSQAALNRAGFHDRFANEKERMGDAHALGVTMGM